MRICLLTRSLYPVIGGSETYVYSLGKALGELGHDVTVVTSTLPDGCARAHPYPFRVLRVPELSEFNAAQAGLRTLVVADQTVSGDFANAIRDWVQGGGNLVLTDSALRVLPALTSIPASAV